MPLHQDRFIPLLTRWNSKKLTTGADSIYEEITGLSLPDGAKATLSSEILGIIPSVEISEADIQAAQIILNALAEGFYINLQGKIQQLDEHTIYERGLQILRPKV